MTDNDKDAAFDAAKAASIHRDRDDRIDATRWRYMREAVMFAAPPGIVLSPDQLDAYVDSLIRSDAMGDAQGSA